MHGTPTLNISHYVIHSGESMEVSANTLNSDVSYQAGGIYPAGATAEDLTNLQIVVKADGSAFTASFPDAIFRSYVLPPITKEEVAKRWLKGEDISFFQDQVNFAVWCATAGCGVSSEDHLKASDPLIRAVFRFHVYYQTRRILDELLIALPTDSSFNALNNPYDGRAYERLCNEFSIDIRAVWHAEEGLGTVHLKSHDVWTQRGGPDESDKHIKTWTAPQYNPDIMTFGPEVSGGRHCGMFDCTYLPPKKAHIEFIQQPDSAASAWLSLIPEKGQGFTRAGVERLNDSIRTYVWAVLVSQAQTRTGILGEGKAFEAQKQFLTNVEKAVGSPVDIAEAIDRYEKVLQNAMSKVDFVFGFGLYMSPSDMLLRIDQNTAGYNNKIIIAEEDLMLGLNSSINDTNPEATPEAPHKAPEKSDSFASGVLVKPHEPPSASRPDINPGNKSTASLEDHEDEKVAVIVVGVALGLLALWFLRWRGGPGH